MKILAALLILTGLSLQAQALPEHYEKELVVRAHPENSYGIPPWSFLSNTSPVINNKGDVALKLMSVNGLVQQAVWLKLKNQPGEVIYMAPEYFYITDPSINDQGVVAFSPFMDIESLGLLTYNSVDKTTNVLVSGVDHNITYFSSHKVLNDGTAVFRGSDPHFNRTLHEYGVDLKSVAQEGRLSFGVPTSYLFNPVVNQKKEWVFKMRLGEKGELHDGQEDRIVHLSLVGDQYVSKVIAQTKVGNAQSPYLALGNSVSISEAGHIVFVGRGTDGKQRLVLQQEGQSTVLAQEGQDSISEIELFAPKVNVHGVTVFRAKNEKGLRGIYLASNQGLMRVIGEGDFLASDVGLTSVLQRSGFPGFAGNPDINDNNELVFAVVLGDGEKIIGDAVYKFSPKK